MPGTLNGPLPRRLAKKKTRFGRRRHFCVVKANKRPEARASVSIGRRNVVVAIASKCARRGFDPVQNRRRVVVCLYTMQPEEVVVGDIQKAPESERGVVYEVRALTNRWVEPQKGPVISSHSSAKAAWAAFKNEPQRAGDGSGRTSTGNYVAKAVVRVDSQGGESMVLPPPAGGGLLSWPYR